MAGAGSIAEAALQALFSADNLTLEKMQSIAADIRRLGASIQSEAKRVQDFKIDIHWKSRVINVPIAIDHIKDLIHDLSIGLKEKIQTIEKPFIDFVHDTKLISMEEVDPNISKLSRGFSELETFVSNLNNLVGNVANALQSALSLTALFDRVINDIEHLEDIFLSQKSKREKVSLTYYKRNA